MIKYSDLIELGEEGVEIWKVKCPNCQSQERVDRREYERGTFHCLNCAKDFKLIKG